MTLRFGRRNCGFDSYQGYQKKCKVKNVKRKIKRRNQALFTATLLLFLFFCLIPNYTEAGLVPCGRSIDDPNTRDIKETDDCTLCHLFILLNNIFTYFFTFILPVTATGLMVWGGFTLLTAGESKTKFEQAKNIITAAVVGLVIILASWIFLNMFLSSIGVAEWTGLKEGWWKIECP